MRAPRIRREVFIGLGGVSATDFRWRTRNPIVEIISNIGRWRGVMWNCSRMDVITTTTLGVGEMG